ncbi:MAG: NAD(+) synthase, partial [Halobacteria archaeon]|nr:NAD(+) synthase [Halobacteria archaeon]
MPGGKSETVDISKTVGRITEFIQGKKREADASVLVLGLSGGIDSAVTSALCVEAVGAENVHGMVMPAGSTRDENTEDAKEHAESLGIEYEVVDIQ